MRSWMLPSGRKIEVTLAREAPRRGGCVEVDDTYGLLRAPRAPRLPGGTATLWGAMTAAATTAPRSAGTVEEWSPRMGWQARIVAVLYDFDEHPATDAVRVRAALAHVIAVVRRRSLEDLALPHDFGVAHGGVALDHWLALLLEVLEAGGATAEVEEEAPGRGGEPSRLDPPRTVRLLAESQRDLERVSARLDAVLAASPWR